MADVLTRIGITSDESTRTAIEELMIERVARRHPEVAAAVKSMGERADLQSVARWINEHDVELPDGIGCELVSYSHTAEWRMPHDVSYDGRMYASQTACSLLFCLRAEVDDISQLDFFAEATALGLTFGACILGWQYSGSDRTNLIQCLKSNGKTLEPATPLFITPDLLKASLDRDSNKLVNISLDALFDLCCCVDTGECIDFASTACALAITDELVADAIEWHRNYERYSFRETRVPITLHAESALSEEYYSNDEQKQDAFLKACRSALISLPVVIPLEFLTDSRESKLLIPGQSIEVQALDTADFQKAIPSFLSGTSRYYEFLDAPCQIIATIPGKERPTVTPNPKLAKYVVDKHSLLGATTWAGLYLLAALIPHLHASVLKNKPVYSDDRGDASYSCQIAFELADAEIDEAIRDALSYFKESRHAPRKTVMPPQPLEIGPYDTSLAPAWPKTAAAQKKAAAKLSKTSARTLPATRLIKAWKCAGLPEIATAENGFLPRGVEFIEVKSKQMGVRRTRIVAPEESANTFPDVFTEIEPDFQEPKTPRVSEMVGQCPSQSRCSAILGDIEAVSEVNVEKLDAQTMLYALYAQGVIDADQLAGYKPIPSC
ncbi:hypothetical protein [uncultured Slackia sp.]|uniref:hypothetical protein n=1 Tax=uncultured Slackia sp. TaxID=665903 RepID=UPI0025F492D1|nr:hypothetical protein [uncultured Slackia sp.]